MKQMDKNDMIEKIKKIMGNYGTFYEDAGYDDALVMDGNDFDHAAEEIADFIMEQNDKPEITCEAGYYEFNIERNGEVIYSFGDPGDDLYGDKEDATFDDVEAFAEDEVSLMKEEIGLEQEDAEAVKNAIIETLCLHYGVERTKKVYGVHLKECFNKEEVDRIVALYFDAEKADEAAADLIKKRYEEIKEWDDKERFPDGLFDRTETSLYAAPCDGFGEYLEIYVEELDVVE